ncbi:MAG: hypothetical protein ACPL88_10145 [Bryobacteraceae bacterium]
MYLFLRIPSIGEGKRIPVPERCPICGNDTWHSHGWVNKSVRDAQRDKIRLQRIQCTRCGKTLRLYPPGLGRGAQSEQLRLLSVFLWSLGATYRGIEGALLALGYRLRHSSIGQNVHQLLSAPPPWLHERLRARKVDLLDWYQSGAWLDEQGGILLRISNGAREILLSIEVLEGEEPERLRDAVAERLSDFLRLGLGNPDDATRVLPDGG